MQKQYILITLLLHYCPFGNKKTPVHTTYIYTRCNLYSRNTANCSRSRIGFLPVLLTPWKKMHQNTTYCITRNFPLTYDERAPSSFLGSEPTDEREQERKREATPPGPKGAHQIRAFISLSSFFFLAPRRFELDERGMEYKLRKPKGSERTNFVC